MPNAKEHALVGAGMGFIGYALYCRFADREFKVSEALLATGACALGSLSPDGLEPAVHSWHRGTCHSVAMGGVAARIASGPWVLGANPDLGTLLLSFFALGYLSHLAMDACTPRCLPLLG
jgi:membrane-bound metal-dependent hydrolase YbcI (DUF457 family)